MADGRWNGSSWVATTTKKRWSGVAWVDLTTAKRWSGVAWVDLPLAGGLSATVSPSAATAVVNNSSPSAPPSITMTSPSVTVSASGGSGAGPTYTWTRVSGSSSVTALSASSATTAFKAVVFGNSQAEATFRCRVVRGTDTVDVFVDVLLRYNNRGVPL